MPVHTTKVKYTSVKVPTDLYLKSTRQKKKVLLTSKKILPVIFIEGKLFFKIYIEGTIKYGSN